MSKAKKLILFALAACLAVSCALPLQAKEFTDDPKKPYEINWYPLYGQEQPDIASVEKAVNEYLRTKLPNTTLKINVMHWGSWWGKMPTMIQSGEYMDIFFVASWWGPYYDLVRQGALLPLNELLDKYGKNLKKALGPQFIEGAKINGKLYAIPVNKENATSAGIIFNKKYLDKYKFDLNKLKKPEDIEPWLEIIKKNEPNVIPWACQDNQGLFNLLPYRYFINDVIPGAVVWNDKKGKVVNQWEQPDLLHYIDVMRRWHEKGYVEPDAAFNGKLSEHIQFGRCFAAYAPLKPGKDKEMSNEHVTWVQKEFTPVTSSHSEATGAMHAISVTSKNPARVMKFLNLLWTDKKLANLIFWGVEGKHYVKVGEDYVRPIPDSGYTLVGQHWAFGNQFLCYLKEGEEPDKWTKFREFNKKAQITVDSGFYFDKVPYTAELAALQSVADEYNGLRCGAFENPRAKIQEMLAKMKKAGLDKVLQAEQEQFAAWLKQKGMK